MNTNTVAMNFSKNYHFLGRYGSNIRKRVLSDIQTTARGGLKNETLSTRESVHLIKFCGIWRPYEEERLLQTL